MELSLSQPLQLTTSVSSPSQIPTSHANQMTHPFSSVNTQPQRLQILTGESENASVFNTPLTAIFSPCNYISPVFTPGAECLDDYRTTDVHFLGPFTMPEYQYAPALTAEGTPFVQAYGESAPMVLAESGSWLQKPVQRGFQFYDPDMTSPGQGGFMQEDDKSNCDLRQFSTFQFGTTYDELDSDAPRRVSDSTLSMSSIDELPELPENENVGGAFTNSDGLTCFSDGSVWDYASLVPSTQSPRRESSHTSQASLKSDTRSRASTPFNPRVSPYTTQSSRYKRWSTGMYSSPSATHGPANQVRRPSALQGSPLNSEYSRSIHSTNSSLSLPAAAYMPNVQAQAIALHGATMMPQAGPFAPEIARQVPSQGLVHLQSSSMDQYSHDAIHLRDPANQPDLFSSLKEEPCDPPESDMKPDDPEMIPHKQELRYPGDLYTPLWVRGQGNKREGWCGFCKPGRWLVLKNSAFWYDKSFTHGVSATSGARFQGPQDMRRTVTNLDIWEGLCGSCDDWIALVSSKKKGTTWFRHAYKCHTHPKLKDIPRRRYEALSSARPRALSLYNVPTRRVSDDGVYLSTDAKTSAGTVRMAPPEDKILPSSQADAPGLTPPNIQVQLAKDVFDNSADAVTSARSVIYQPTPVFPSSASLLDEMATHNRIDSPYARQAEPSRGSNSSYCSTQATCTSAEIRRAD